MGNVYCFLLFKLNYVICLGKLFFFILRGVVILYILIFYVRWVNWCFNLNIGLLIVLIFFFKLLDIILFVFVCFFIGNCYILLRSFFLCFLSKYWLLLLWIRKIFCLMVFLFKFLVFIGNFCVVFIWNVL